MQFYSSINALGTANLIHRWVVDHPSGDQSAIESDASGPATMQGQCWPTSGTGAAPSQPRGMLAPFYTVRIALAHSRHPHHKSLNKSRSRPYDEGWDDHDETLGMPTCAEIAWHSGAILVEIIIIYINVLGSSRSTCGGQFIRRRVITPTSGDRSTIEYDTAQQVEQVLGPQAPRKQPHRQLEWVEAPWDGRDTHAVGPWSFQGAVLESGA
ncbi:uncharacterized protein EI90DRAFT_3036881 [Cantharellus anzutake]|uniref:uncharacterized protein n=1 Tax=Cantharellus anzutake TaxID=1750568 RepID=UPI0019049696|nr:uncharacterized protein EI90DRAFT_3036881 [Cantharellus anzutake]KAF8339519.1 hypothetical protein EI90DRAFT_3036881 [Cantharellus anzutake]